MTAQIKAFVDRNYFLYTHGIPIRALKRFLKLSADIPDDRIVTLTGYASKPGEVKSNLSLVEEVRKLGGRLAEILTSAHSPRSA